MSSDPWTAFASALGTVGPVGITLLAGWYLWLRYGRPNGRANVSSNQMVAWHAENRDMIRDTNALVNKIEQMDTRVLEHMNNIVAALLRLSELQRDVTIEIRRIRGGRRDA